MLSRSRSSWDHHLNKLGRPYIPNATDQVSSSLAFWFWRRRFLKGFYHIWVWWTFLSCDQNVLYKFWLTYHKESLHEIWVQLNQWFVRKLSFNILIGPQYERPWLKGQRPSFETYFTAIVSYKLGRPHIPNATYQVPRSSAFWFWKRRFLKDFYHIWAWRPSWSCDQDHLKKISFPRPKESPYEIWV